MKRLLVLLLLIVFAGSHQAHASVVVENLINTDDVETRAFVTRLENVLSQTGKRIREVFGFTIDVKAVVGPSAEDYDILIEPQEPAADAQTNIILINSRIIRKYPIEDLKIAAGRALYRAVWPRFRKSTASATALVRRMYDEGMTAYAAELLCPGMPRWKYAGLYGSEGRKRYREYLPIEKDLAREVLRALSSGSSGSRGDELFPERGAGAQSRAASAGLLSYRLMKTLEKDLDPKMIQLMGITEFEQRLPGGLEVLERGFKGRWE